jgi:ADP-ribosylglycohydrolase
MTLSDPSPRLALARLALDGLSLGDALGERFFVHEMQVGRLIEQRAIPQAPWFYTDDTAMALSIVEVLERHGSIDQDALALAFARRYQDEPRRGYGGGAHTLLRAICEGARWQDAAPALFSGQGSFGNGGAMRAAPLGAYFFDDPEAVVVQARASAEVTHAHPDGQAGAIAVALAASFAARHRGAGGLDAGEEMLRFVLERTPPSATRDGIEQALGMFRTASLRHAAVTLGTGYRVSSSDTVPFCLLCAGRHLDSFPEAFWATVSGLGDRDTTCAIVGGIVALSVGPEGIPPGWLASREALG